MRRGLPQNKAGWTRALAALALLAMLVRGLVPAGYMLGPTGGEGRLAVLVCAQQGPASAFLDLSTGDLVDAKAPHAPSHGKDGANGHCLFAVAAALSKPEMGAGLVAPAVAASVHAPLGLAETAPGRGLAAPPPWSTGPPLTA